MHSDVQGTPRGREMMGEGAATGAGEEAEMRVRSAARDSDMREDDAQRCAGSWPTPSSRSW